LRMLTRQNKSQNLMQRALNRLQRHLGIGTKVQARVAASGGTNSLPKAKASSARASSGGREALRMLTRQNKT